MTKSMCCFLVANLWAMMPAGTEAAQGIHLSVAIIFLIACAFTYERTKNKETK